MLEIMFTSQKVKITVESYLTGKYIGIQLSWVATVVFNVRLLHAVAFWKKLPLFEPTNVITLKTQVHAVNACVKRSSQRSFSDSIGEYRVPGYSTIMSLFRVLEFLSIWTEYSSICIDRVKNIKFIVNLIPVNTLLPRSIKF